jgi:hypothetical protein
MRPLVGHKIMERRARVIAAKTAETDLLLCGALPEPASFDIIVRAAAAAAIAVRGSAGSAIETARPELRRLHGEILLLAISILLVLRFQSRRFFFFFKANLLLAWSDLNCFGLQPWTRNVIISVRRRDAFLSGIVFSSWSGPHVR